jgi:hypothetical protein
VGQRVIERLQRLIDVDLAFTAAGADVREFALLWLVFALLDSVMADKLTLLWLTGNFAGCTTLWICGAYIELRRR